MKRIAWHVGLARDAGGRMREPERMWSCLSAYADELVDEQTSVEIRFVERSNGVLTHPFSALANTAQLVRDVVRAQEEGIDAVMIAPGVDPGLHEARATVEIPVTGTAESSLAVSQMLAQKVGIISPYRAYAHYLAADVARYGLRERLIARDPIRLFELDYDAVEASLDGRPEQLWEEVSGAARQLVADGADLVIVGFQFLGATLWQGGVRDWSIDGAPLLDCAAAGLKVTEMMLDLERSLGIRKSVAPFSPFRTIDAATLAATCSLLDGDSDA
ncbi:MAG: aspartate/glutamate racemase family protein [Solirubrobacteraceae bacterium]